MLASAKDDDPDTISILASPNEWLTGRSRRASDPTALRWSVAWLTDVGDRVGDALVHSSAYLAVIATVYVSIPIVLLSLPPNPAPIVVGLIAFAVYANDRILDVEEDEATNPDRAAFVRRNERLLHILAAVAYGLAVAISVLGGVMALAIALLPGMFWVLYATDWIPGVWFRVKRLKEIFVINSAVVALAWALSATFLPIAFADAAVTEAAVVVFGYFLLRSFVNTEIPNVRDVASDRAAAVSTLPVVVGATATRRILYGLDGLAILLVTAAVLEGLLPTGPAIALLVGLGYSLVVAGLIGRVEDLELLAIAAELEYLVVGGAIAVLLYVH